MNKTDQPNRIQRVSAAEATFEALRSLIQSEAISVGDRLPGEIELARAFGVSRAILREALGACATLGLTEARTGSGTYVLAKTPRMQLSFGGYSASDLIEARQHVEVPAAGYAAERHTEQQIQGLRELVVSMRNTSDLHKWVQLDGELHRRIAESSGNPVLASMTTMMRQALDPQSEFLNITMARQSRSDDEHDSLVEAIASGSSLAAQAAAANHINAVAEALNTPPAH